MAERIRLVLADDHAIMRQGLALLLEEEPDMEVVAQAEDGCQAVQMVREHTPDIVLLDINMPRMSGLEAARNIAVESHAVKILILTMYEEEGFFFEALRCGASGYVLKGAQSNELVGAVRTVCEGGVYLSPELAGHLVRDYLDRNPPSPDDLPLTSREIEVLALIARGYTNQQIADTLVVSVNTVKTHRLHIYQKLDLHGRTELLDYASRHGLV